MTYNQYIMIIYYDLLLKRIITIFILIALVSFLCLSSSYFRNNYVIAARSLSSSLHKTTGARTIQICCSWDGRIDGGILTYRIIGSGNSQVVKTAVHQAINEWNSKVPNIKLQESTNNNIPADIDIKIASKAPQVAHATVSTIAGGSHAIAASRNIRLVQPGEAVISFDARGLITHVGITISTKAFGNAISSSELESIAKHEIGHAYGIGHTNFGTDLMSPILFTGRTDTSISQCDINGIEEANQWQLKAGGSTGDSPHAPSAQFLRC